MGKMFQYKFWEKFEKDENDESSSARSENVMVKPKKFTVGSPLSSGKALLLIFHLRNVLKTWECCSRPALLY